MTSRHRTSRVRPPSSSAEWLTALHDLWTALDLRLYAARGRSYHSQVPADLAPIANVIECTLEGSDVYLVTIAPGELGLDGECTCPGYDEEWSCKHLAAVVEVLRERLKRGVGFVEGHDGAAARIEHALTRYGALSTTARLGTIWWRLRFGPADVSVTPVLEGSGARQALSLESFEFRCSGSVASAPEDLRLAQLLRSLSLVHRSPRQLLTPVAILDFLVGHPRVAPEGVQEASPLARGTAGVAVVAEEGGFRLRPAVDGVPVVLGAETGAATPQGFVLWNAERKQATVAPVPGPLSDLLASVAGVRAVLPFERAAALIDRIERGHPELVLTLPEAFARKKVAASGQLVLVLTPESDDLAAKTQVALRARPIPGGPAVAPGEGSARLHASVAGERLETDRALATEVARAGTVAKELELPLQPPTWDTHLVGEALLDLLLRFDDRFKDRPDEVLLEWPADALPRSVTRFERDSFRVEVKARQDWFDLEGTVGTEDDQLDLATLLAAIREGRRYVPLGGGRHAAIAGLIQGRLADLALLARDAKKGAVEVPRAAVALAADVLADLPVAKAPVAWTKVLARAKDAAALEPELPDGLRAELRAYQGEGFRWLARLAALGVGGCLADDMGLGKTVQAIAALVARKAEGPALVVAPTSVGFNWERELARFAPGLRVRPYRAADRATILDDARAGDVVVTSWGLLRRDAELIAAREWGTVVLDEAQAIKNGACQTARAARALQAGWTVALTGTPVENHLGELWSLFSVIVPGLLGSFEQFAARFARPIQSNHDPERRAALARLVRPFILRRTKGQVLKELPERTEVRLDVELSKAERTRYEDARLEAIAALAAPRGDGDPRFQVLAALTRLRQLACHPRLVDGSAPASSSKLEALLEQLDTVLAEGHTALVFSQFVKHLELVRAALHARKVKHLWLEGSTPPRERARLVDAFQGGAAPVFLISLKAGGTGLNLTAADYVFLLDPWWNPAVEDQAADRAHRLGQTRAVTVVRLVSRGTIEEKVLALHAEKRDLVAGVLEGTGRAGALSTDELVDLLRDSALSSSGGGAPPKPRTVALDWGGVGELLEKRWDRECSPATARAYKQCLAHTLGALGPAKRVAGPALAAHFGALARGPVVVHGQRATVLRQLLDLLAQREAIPAIDLERARDALAIARGAAR